MVLMGISSESVSTLSALDSIAQVQAHNVDMVYGFKMLEILRPLMWWVSR
jgi:hypothetical protein